MDDSYQPYDMDSFQSYHPLYKVFFELNDSNYNHVAFNHRYHAVDLKTVWDSKSSRKGKPRDVCQVRAVIRPRSVSHRTI